MYSLHSTSSTFQKIGIVSLLSLSFMGSVLAAAPATPPGETDGGWFSLYFHNIVNTNCIGMTVLTSFSGAADSNYGKGNCVSIGPIIGSFFQGYGSALAGQAVTGFNSTGAPIFNTVSWNGTPPGSIYYTGASVGIGTSVIQAGAKLQVGGAIRALGGTPNAADSSTRGFAFDSDGDTGLFSTTSANPNISNGLGLYTNSSLGIYIDSTISPAPFVGIGTNAPQAKLDVSGDALVNSITVGRGSGNVASNTALGFQTLSQNVSGVYNTAVGYRSLFQSTANGNSANGYAALYLDTSGQYNTANGFSALYQNSSGNYNTANGASSLRFNDIGSNNTANGYAALYLNTSGVSNVANGYASLYKNDSGAGNVANGVNALYTNSLGNYNTALGYKALYNTSGSNNIALGAFAGQNLTSGTNNIAIGYNATLPDPNGSNQLAIGNFIYGTSGNIGIGTNTPTSKLMVQGGAIGGKYAILPSYATWSQYGVGDGGAAIYNDNGTYKKLMIIGNNSAGGAREIGMWDNLTVNGNSLITGNVGIGTMTPGSKLDVVGQIISRYLNDASGVYSQFRAIWGNYGFMIRNDGANTYFLLTNPGDQQGQWNALRPFIINNSNGEVAINTKLTVNGNVFAQNYYYTSDRRLKKDIVPIVSPLEKIKALNGYTFEWKDTGSKSVGVIAQEVEKVFPELVGETQTASGMTIKTVQYGNLVAPLIESVKELSRLHDQDQKNISELENEVKQMHEDIESLKQQIKK